MNCIDNLPKCEAGCCKLVVMTIPSFPGDVKEDYFKKRGIRVKRINRKTVKLFIPHQCAQLTPDNRCKLHGTDKKPSFCTMLNEKTANAELFHITKNCIYGEESK